MLNCNNLYVGTYLCFIKSVQGLLRGSGWDLGRRAEVLLGLTPDREGVGGLVRQEERTLGNVGCCGLKVRQQSICENTKQRFYIITDLKLMRFTERLV